MPVKEQLLSPVPVFSRRLPADPPGGTRAEDLNVEAGFDQSLQQIALQMGKGDLLRLEIGVQKQHFHTVASGA